MTVERYTGRMRYLLSASQLVSFHPGRGEDGCPRKWALTRLLGLPKVESEALADGTLLHGCLEQYAASPEQWARDWSPHSRAGMTPEQARLAKIARMAMAMWPHRTPGPAVVEPTWFLEVPEIDTAFYIKPDRMGEGGASFDDWKSTSAENHFGPWVLHSRDQWPPKGPPSWVKLLERDIQANLYAHGICTRFARPETAARWVYGSKRFAFSKGAAPKAWSTSHTFTAQAARDYCETYLWPAAQAMNALREAHKSLRIDSLALVPHNPPACNYTGRFCDAVAHCPMTYESLVKLRLPAIPKANE